MLKNASVVEAGFEPIQSYSHTHTNTLPAELGAEGTVPGAGLPTRVGPWAYCLALLCLSPPSVRWEMRVVCVLTGLLSVRVSLWRQPSHRAAKDAGEEAESPAPGGTASKLWSGDWNPNARLQSPCFQPLCSTYMWCPPTPHSKPTSDCKLAPHPAGCLTHPLPLMGPETLHLAFDSSLYGQSPASMTN